MNVGMVSTRFAGTDGVSLETAKLAEVLESEGHQVVWFAGELGKRFRPGITCPLAHFEHPINRRLEAAFFRGEPTPPRMMRTLRALTWKLKKALRQFLTDFEVDAVVAQNVLCLPMQLPLGVALTEVLSETGLPAVGHHHDFGWERDRFSKGHDPHLLHTNFPPALRNLRHMVIQSYAKQELRRRRGLDATVLPNVMDFERGPLTSPDGAAFRRAAGLDARDLVLLQPTRVVPRKSIETTLRLAHELADPAVKVVVTHDDGDEGPDYGRFLRAEADRLQVDLRFVPTRAEPADASERPLLADAYAAANLVAYPSLIEGFGNALLEALFYRCPVLVNRYPVYVRDIAPTGLRCVEIEDCVVTPEAVKEAAACLENRDAWQEITDHNYEVCRGAFSYNVIRERFLPLLPSLPERQAG
ncbi:MAG TPA: glycosyltransferase family 4 protein [Actinomycetota bacterium]